MNTGLEYNLALRVRDATRWAEKQQGLLPGDEPFVPPIGYGASVGSGQTVIEVGEMSASPWNRPVSNDAIYANGKVVNLKENKPDTYGSDVWIRTWNYKLPAQGARVFARKNGTHTISDINRPLYIIDASGSDETVDITPWTAKTIYSVNPITGALENERKEVLWQERRYSVEESPLYFCEQMFQQGSYYNESLPTFRPSFFANFNCYGYDRTENGSANSWAGELPYALWYAGVSTTRGMRMQPSKAQSFKSVGYINNPTYGNTRWVYKENNYGTIRLREINIFSLRDCQQALRDMGFLYQYHLFLCNQAGNPVSFNDANKTGFCTRYLYPILGLKIIYGTNGLIYNDDFGYISFNDLGVFSVMQVFHNNAPNKPITTPSSTLGAPLGAPLGG